MPVLCQCDASPDKGTSWIPAPGPDFHARESRARARILVVDDDAAVRKLIVRILEAFGYEDVVVAENGAEALAAAMHDPTFDLVITDIRMPVMDGRELARQLRTLRERLPMIFISGYTAEGAPAGGPAEAATAFVPKPLDESVLIRCVHRILAGR